MTSSANRTRSLALAFFAFVAVFAAIVWFLVRPYGSAYFFPVHFLVGLGLPFLFYAIGASRAWFWLGLAATALALAWLNLGAHDAGGLAPRTLDWSHVCGGALGLLLAWGVHYLYRRMRPPHHASIGR
ncbi:MAG TPA: hypothetical protein DDZ67_02795 [Xanthomonadaceae bacterium]|nr:hypothetical protein [Xanthomonadaceae bacterium]